MLRGSGPDPGDVHKDLPPPIDPGSEVAGRRSLNPNPRVRLIKGTTFNDFFLEK